VNWYILLVEDNEINRLIVYEMLKSEGIIVHEAHNGQEAVELAQAQKYAAILMDVSMPIMNGIDATRTIRSTSGPNQKTKILGLTAHALAEEQERFITSGMDDCLNKPVSQTTLLNALVSDKNISETIAQPIQDFEPQQSCAARSTIEITPTTKFNPSIGKRHACTQTHMRSVEALATIHN